jgi:hypothetical protein
MITISPVKEVLLPYRIFFVRCAESGHVVAASREGAVTVFGPGLAPLSSFDVGRAIHDVSIAPNGESLALCSDGSLSLNRVSDGHEQFATSIGKRCAVEFADSDRLWTVSADEDGVEVTVELRETTKGRVLRANDFRDPLDGGSHCSFHRTNRADAIAIWVAAGQDGQWIFWAHDTGRSIAIKQARGISECTPPEFNTDGDEFLILESDQLSRWYFAKQKRLTTFSKWPWVETEDDDVGTYVGWVGRDRALVKSNGDRLYLVDIEQGRLVDEVAIAGHLPRPVSELFPSLKHEVGLTTDVSYFVADGQGRMLSVHRDLPRSAKQKREKNRLALWDTRSLATIPRHQDLRSRIMYIESKAGGLIGPARIGRVQFSKAGKTLYYAGKEFRSLRGSGFKANFYEVETGDEYWISGCKKDGSDRLYGERLPIEIDEDVRDEYWSTIRGKPTK